MSLDRRQFVTRSLGALGAAGVGAAGGLAAAPRAHADEAPTAEQTARAALGDHIPFDGAKQSGILTPTQAQATFVALDAMTDRVADLASALQSLSYKARALTAGGNTGVLDADRDPTDDPPRDSGILGVNVLPDSLTVTIALGASLFDHRFGLASKRPAGLVAMPRFPTDKIDASISHGDVLVQVCGGQRDTVVHGVRELLRGVRGTLEPRWSIEGFQSAQRGPRTNSARRNLFAFRDGTGNPETNDAELMDRLVWTQPGADMPAWAVGGTFQIVRIIRMHVEFWDRVGLREQEQMIGRVRESGAPLGGTTEHEDPRYDLDPKGERIPLDAHIRLANPRTEASANQRFLRRGYNYSRGFDSAGGQDQGLVFVAFNQDPERQFATVQRRLSDEPMTDYITPIGGGYFFAPPGTGGDKLSWIGQKLFTT